MYGPGSELGPGEEEDTEDDRFFREVIMELSKFGTENQVKQWRNELSARTDIITKNKDKIMLYIEDLRKQMNPVLIGHDTCVRRVGLYNADLHKLPKSGTITNCGGFRR